MTGSAGKRSRSPRGGGLFPAGLSRRGSRRTLSSVAAGILVLGALLLNQWTVERFVLLDGRLESVRSRAVLWSFDGLLLVMALFIGRKRPHLLSGLVLATATSMIVTVVCFGFFEVFGGLVPDSWSESNFYYAVRTRFQDDDKLGYRRKPWSRVRGVFRGDLARFAKEEVPARSYEAHYNADGFRVGSSTLPLHLALVADSHGEIGMTPKDLIASRLERCSGWNVRSYSISGYGPDQYLEVVRRFVIRDQPEVAAFCFYEGNDMLDMKRYTRWQETGLYPRHELLAANAAQRFLAWAKSCFVAVGLANPKRHSQAEDAPPLAIVPSNEGDREMLFWFQAEETPVEALRKEESWSRLGTILADFRDLCDRHGVKPVTVFIPMKSHVLAPFTTSASSSEWMAVRDQQIRDRGNVETAFRTLAESAGLDVISLTEPFTEAVRVGEIPYYPYDTHWNSQGRQIAAEFLAAELVALPLLTESTSARN